jgi:CubicO group peptidase (beta-lactamase class C family)
MSEVHGYCDERFRALGDLFRANIERGIDHGASLAATLDGEFVVDLWGGYRDRARTKPWQHDTLVNVFSTSKAMVIVAMLMMVDRGLLDLDAPVAQYWPEFGRHGKDVITTRQILVHRSGLPGFGQQIAWDDAHNWQFMIGVLEDAELWFEPGTMSCYHSQTFGFLLGEIVRRLSGLPFDEFFRNEIAAPLSADFQFGVRGEHDQSRVAQLLYPMNEHPMPSAMGDRAFNEFEQREWVSPDRMAAVLPASGGLATAKGLATIGAMLAMGGELNGRRYLGADILDQATTEQSYAEDEVLGWCRYGLGFGLDSPEFPGATPTSFHWGGYGGSFITMDRASRISCGFAPNRLVIDDGVYGDRLTEMWQTLGEISLSLS